MIRIPGIVVGIFGTINKTTDGGANWIPQYSGSQVVLKSVSFPDANNGTVVGLVGRILHTTNGGTDWTQQIESNSRDLYGVSFHRCK